MDSHANSEFFSLAEEKFDFDVSLSPASSRGDEDDDEVFVGPVCHKERCISIGLETVVKESVSSWPSVGEGPSWSPLAVDKFEEICKEANLLASQLVVDQQHPDVGVTNGTLTLSKEEPKEDFVQDAGAKLGMFRKPVDAVLSPIKRETFCVQDSPLKQLPPAIQQRLLRAGGVSNSTKSSVGTSSPVRAGTTTQPKMVRRGRVGLTCNTGVLPNKQQPAARGATATTALQTAKTRPAPAERTTMLAPPSKGNLGLRRSPGSRNSSRAASCEDLLSDTASVASDISDTSLNSSLQGKRILVPPSKSGMRAPSVVKAPPPQTRRVTDRRRNTSSSSSSVSSFNSSLSVSPTGKGKLSASLNSSICGPNGRLPAGKSRLTNPVVSATKTCRSTLISRAPELPSSTTVACRVISDQGRKHSEQDRFKTVQSTPLKSVEPAATATPLHQTPAKMNMERMSSLPNIPTSSSVKTKSVVKGNPKLKGFIAPTPTSQFKRRLEAVSSPDAPRIMKPKRLMSACSVESLPHKLALPVPELFQTPPAGGNKAVQPKTRRPSALPTPVNRRVSGIPMLTPNSISRPGRPSLSMAILPASIQRASYWSPAQVKGSHQEEVAAAPEEETVQPFSLEDEPEVQPSIPAKVPHPEEQEVSQDVPEPGVDKAPPAANKENNHPEPNEESKELENTEKLLVQPQCNWMKTQEVNEVMS
uniref:G-2 and S-phase expressed 1 n=1 Tax=Hucho hucho TaxID=62062 RepID=A0A4W5NQU9_9TELE